MKKNVILVLLVIIILAFDCQMPTRKIKNEDQESHFEDRDGLLKSGIFDAPGLKAYVGFGYNLLEEGKPLVGRALNRDVASDSVLLEYEGHTSYKYILIEDSSDLRALDSLEVEGSVEGAYGVFSIEGNAKYAIENSLSISNKSISVLVIAQYNYGTVILNKTEFNGDYLTLLNEDKEGFYESFGNGYSRRTKLGGYLFSLFTFSLKEMAVMEHETLRADVEAELAGLFAVKGRVDIESLYALRSEHVEVSANLFAIGPPEYIPGIPENNEQMTSEIINFKEKMTAAFSTVDLNDPETCLFLPCLGTQYESYEDLAERLDTINTYSCDIDEYYNKKMSWWRLYGKLDRVRKDLNANTFDLPIDVINSYITQINSAIEQIDIQMNLCKNRDTNAIYAENHENIDEYNDLINILKIKLEYPGIFTVVDQGEEIRLSWDNDLGLSEFTLLLRLGNSEAEPINKIDKSYYDYIQVNPGVTEWSVLGYNNNGVPPSSVRQSFIVPGFDFPDTEILEGFTIPGTTIRFYIVNNHDLATGMTNVLCVKKDSEPEQRIDLFDNTYVDYTFEEADALYTVWVEGSCNGTTGKSTALTIETSNNPPVLNPIGNKTVSNGSTLSFIITANDAENDTLTFSASSMPEGAVLDANTGIFNWTPLGTQLGTYTVIFEVSDGEDTDTQEVIITCYNNPPLLNHIENKNISNGETLSFTITGTDTDNDTLKYYAEDMPFGATLKENTGEFNWTPSNGQSEEYTVTFYVTDEKDTDSQEVTITCDNIPPILEYIENTTIFKNNKLTFTITGSDDDGDTLRYGAYNIPSGATLDEITGEFNWTPDNSQAGIYTINFFVTDEIDTDVQEVIIVCQNKLPDLYPISNKTVYEDKTLEFTITGIDDDGDTLTYSYDKQASQMPEGASLDENTGKFSWDPSDGQSGIYDIYFTANDGDDNSESQKVTITCWDLFVPAADVYASLYGGADYVPEENRASCGGASGQYGGYGKVTFIMTGGSRYRAEFNISISTGIGGFGYFSIAGEKITTTYSSLQIREWTSGNCFIYAGSNGSAKLTNLKFYRKPEL